MGLESHGFDGSDYVQGGSSVCDCYVLISWVGFTVDNDSSFLLVIHRRWYRFSVRHLLLAYVEYKAHGIYTSTYMYCCRYRGLRDVP